MTVSSSISTVSPFLLFENRGFSSRFFSIAAPTDTSVDDFLTRVSAQLPHMVQHILPENPSIQFRWQQEVSHLQRRHHTPQQTTPLSRYRLQEWQEWCCRGVCDDIDDISWQNNRGYGPWLGELPLTCSDDTAAEIDVVSFQNATMALSPKDDLPDGLSYATTAISRYDAEIRTSDPERKQALFKALALLRVMTTSDWAPLDNVEEESICNNDHDLERTIIVTEEDDVLFADDIPDDVFIDQLHAFSKQTNISMDDHNLLLARLALALDLERDDVAALLMHEFTSMCQAKTPDAASYEILLSALVHRLQQFDSATQVVEHMIQNRSSWTPECLTAAMYAYKGRGRRDDAWDLLQTVYTNPAREFKIQNKTFQVVVEVALSEQRSDEVLQIMEMAMKETRRRSDTNVEKILLLGLNCSSTKDRQATEFLTKVMTILEERTVMVPSDRVWRHFIYVAFSRRRRKDKVLGQLIRQAFHNWALFKPSFRPSDSFLSIGLAVSESLCDAEFAADLVLRCLRRDGGKVDSASIPILQIIRAVNICIESGDVHKGRLILDRCIAHPNIHTAMRHKMYASVLRGYAEAGDTVAARQLLSVMAESSIPIK
jgi:pentatricopeptide repeat protein